MAEYVYGVISDIHKRSPQAVKRAIANLEARGANFLVGNGDICCDEVSGSQEDHFAQICQYFGESGLEGTLYPGSHEEVIPTHSALLDACSTHSNLIHPFKDHTHKHGNHWVTFVPGSNVLGKSAQGAGYLVASRPNKGALIERGDSLLMVIDPKKQFAAFPYPDKTILFTHVPAKTQGLALAIDHADFAVLQEPYGPYPTSTVIPKVFINEDEQHVAYEQTNKPVGCEHIAKLAKQYGLRKHVNGHIHERVGMIHKIDGSSLEEGEYSSDLQVMASYMDKGIMGLIRVKDNKISYEQVDLE